MDPPEATGASAPPFAAAPASNFTFDHPAVNPYPAYYPMQMRCHPMPMQYQHYHPSMHMPHYGHPMNAYVHPFAINYSAPPAASHYPPTTTMMAPSVPPATAHHPPTMTMMAPPATANAPDPSSALIPASNATPPGSHHKTPCSIDEIDQSNVHLARFPRGQPGSEEYAESLDLITEAPHPTFQLGYIDIDALMDPSKFDPDPDDCPTSYDASCAV